MINLKALEYWQQHPVAEMQEFIDSVVSTRTNVSAYAANNLLLERIGLRVEARDESYHSEAMHYHLGILYGYMNKPERAAEHIALSHTLPSTGGDQLYPEHVHDSLELWKRWQPARERGMPSVLIAAMPRSASATLTQTLAGLLDVPVVRLSIGNFVLVPTWVKLFAAGGALTHDHFDAGPFNLATIAGNGIRDVFVLVRDPRSAAASARRRAAAETLRRTGQPVAPEQYEREVLDVFEWRYVPWIRDWLACAAEPPAGVRIHVIQSTDVRNRIADVVRRILNALRADHPALNGYIDAPVTEVRANFVEGNDDAWRSRISQQGRDRMWSLLPKQAVSFLALRP